MLQQGILPSGETEVLTKEECMEETAFMALRMNQGVNDEIFFHRYGEHFEEYFQDAILYCKEKKWLEKNQQGCYALTQTGRMYGNLVFEQFIK